MNLQSVKDSKFWKNISKLPHEFVEELQRRGRTAELEEKRLPALSALAKLDTEEEKGLEALESQIKEAEAKKDQSDKIARQDWAVFRGLHIKRDVFKADLERRREPHTQVLSETYHRAIDETYAENERLLEEARKAVRDEKFNVVRGKQVLVSNNDDWHRRAMYLFDSLKKIEDLKLTSLDDDDAEKKLAEIRDGIPVVRSVVRDGENWILA